MHAASPAGPPAAPAAAADLSPLAIAVSTFFTKVRIRDFRAWLRAVRVTV